MEEPLKIFMGVPHRKYFYMPWEGTFPDIGREIIFINSRTKKETKGTVVECFTESWYFLKERFSTDHFNLGTADLKKALEEGFPQYRHKEEIRFIRLLET